MDLSRRRAGSRPLAELSRLHAQLRLLVPLLAVAEDHPDTGLLLGKLAETLADVDALLTAVEPLTLDIARAGLKHATAREHNEARSAFLVAFHRLSGLLQADNPRRLAAADEPTERWTPVRRLER
ncbi:MAG: hypothetical protein ACRDQB_15855 [Thermocrispum sp.]